MKNVSIVHLNAGHDVNGNPRRLYVLLTPKGVVGAADEGYMGESVLDAFGKGLSRQIVLGLAITPGEYRSLKKRFAAAGILRRG